MADSPRVQERGNACHSSPDSPQLTRHIVRERWRFGAVHTDWITAKLVTAREPILQDLEIHSVRDVVGSIRIDQVSNERGVASG